MRKTLLRFSSSVGFCLCAIALATNISLAGIPNSARVLASLDDDWSKAASTRDIERVVSFYAEDAVVYPPNEKIVTGKSAMKEAWERMLADPKAKLTWKTNTAGVDHNTGFTAGTYQVLSPEGAVLETGKYLCVWRKGSDGRWKAIHDMWNSDSR
jgi:ketosteroid isomerase-like protein